MTLTLTLTPTPTRTPTVFIIQEQGQIRQQKRLDYFASCLTPYLYSGDSKIQNIMIGTYNNSIQIYNDVSLIWVWTGVRG